MSEPGAGRPPVRTGADVHLADAFGEPGCPLCRERGLAAVINLHNVPLARRFCPRILGLVEGRLVFDGPPSALDDVVLERVYGAEAIEARHDRAGAHADEMDDVGVG